jgi:transposase-like protein
MSTPRVYTRECRGSAVGLVLSEGLSIRKAADDLGMPYHTLHGWVRAVLRSRRKPCRCCSRGRRPTPRRGCASSRPRSAS